MVEIKTTYLEEYKETLMDEIMIRYEDEQKSLLMALIKGKRVSFSEFFKKNSVSSNQRIFIFLHNRMETRKEGMFHV